MKKNYFLEVIVLLISFYSANSQVTVTGSNCVVAGGTNGSLYTISGVVQATDVIKWTIVGGTIANNGNTSATGSIGSLGSQIRIVWKSGTKNGSLQVTHNRLGSASLNVTIVTFSNAISASIQTINPGAPLKVSGGGPDMLCQPVYSFWWEVADSSIGPFIAINNAIGQHLTIDSVKKRAYYRRVICANGENYYSNTLLIDISQTSVGFHQSQRNLSALSFSHPNTPEISNNLRLKYLWLFENDRSFTFLQKLELN